MKKLMIVTAALAISAVAEAGIAVSTVNCVKGSTPSGCPEVVFKVTGSGKALDPFNKDYTTVSKLKVNGWLVMFPEISTIDGGCCYPYYSLYVSAKIGKRTTNLIFAGAESEAIDAWTVFGKKLAKAEASVSEPGKKDKKFKLESQLGISANYTTANGYSGGTLVYADDVEGENATPAIAFFATAFGKATWKTLVTPGCNKCDKPTLDGYEVTPGTYSGWFAGVYEWEGIDEECLTCGCTDLGLFGGTWKAKYQTKVATWEAAAADVFGAAALKSMQTAEIE